MNAKAAASRRAGRGSVSATIASVMALSGFAIVAPTSAALLLTSPAIAADEAKPAVPQWQEILALQLLETYRCDFDKVLFVRELKVGESTSTEGRARCLDGREYDFSRDRAHEKFTLRLCQPTVC